MAEAGSVRRFDSSASTTLPMAYWPARNCSLRLSSDTTTPIERVPASAAGAMRSIRPVTGCAAPSTVTCTG